MLLLNNSIKTIKEQLANGNEDYIENYGQANKRMQDWLI
jgi:hypothetical protein